MNKIVVVIGLLAVVVVLGVLVGGRIRQKNRMQPAPTIEELQSGSGYPVRVAGAAREDIDDLIEVDGTVEPDRKAVLVSRYDRLIESISVDEGDPVAAGDVLVVLEHKAVELRVEAEQAALDEAEKNLTRARALYSSGAISRQDLDRSEVATDRMKASLQENREELENMYLASPLTGFVSRRYREPGELSGVGEPLLEIVDIDRVEVHCRISEQLIAGIRRGQNVKVRFDAYPEKTWEGTVDTINPTANSISRLFTVKIGLNNREHLLRPGMYARTSIVREIHEQAVLIPRSALVRNEEGESGVFLVCAGNSAHFQPVRTGIVAREMVEILGGMDGDCLVVVEGQDKLADGATVKVIAADESGEE
ncbi:MAG TPA: efflux RND transporter periplasmic adaptor subunit [bacterium]|nr:efflux RND transporter periplasmic adaptor subunit [bacterium]HPJ71384.1 efflux RND transporter periplasmic adaptor subunit [bacterium]HPQ65420.1 efflux RND transporter periplasmic adaptor subunit [bacterium]